MDICFEGIGQTVATFAAKEELDPGTAVTLTSNGEVGLGQEGGPLCGITVGAARDGVVAVQISGVIKVSRSDGGKLEPGWRELACDGTGKIKAASGGGTKFLVLSADEKSVVIRL